MKENLIIRIAGDGQFEVPGDEKLLAKLNTLEGQIAVLLRESQGELSRLMEKMAALVREQGCPLATELVESDLILPPPDLSLAEAEGIFAGGGLVPG